MNPGSPAPQAGILDQARRRPHMQLADQECGPDNKYFAAYQTEEKTITARIQRLLHQSVSQRLFQPITQVEKQLAQVACMDSTCCGWIACVCTLCPPRRRSSVHSSYISLTSLIHHVKTFSLNNSLCETKAQ